MCLLLLRLRAARRPSTATKYRALSPLVRGPAYTPNPRPSTNRGFGLSICQFTTDETAAVCQNNMTVSRGRGMAAGWLRRPGLRGLTEVLALGVMFASGLLT